MEMKPKELIQRYKQNYQLAHDFSLTYEMIMWHWELERELRTKLLASNADNRWSVFENVYSQLFGQIYWLNRDEKVEHSRTAYFQQWKDVIGQPPMRIYEIGSGQGGLIQYLADSEFDCRGTEITTERGQKWAVGGPNLSWGTSDGVHLDRFELSNDYDVVISDQVIEHIHPDDIPDHLQGVYSILKPGGRYILSTPHAFTGPWDVSRVFCLEAPMGTHLKEYTYNELLTLIRSAGFKSVTSVFRLPIKLQRWFKTGLKARSSQMYMDYLCALENMISIAPTRWLRKTLSTAAGFALFARGIFLVAQK
jgi:2-polyprenyl-3-methyl-5-hydroxy-6-metoxy-1,4-benzoquinol methylase